MHFHPNQKVDYPMYEKIEIRRLASASCSIIGRKRKAATNHF